MKPFFDIVRAELGALSQSQVDGFNVLLAASDDLPLRHQAYVLATSWHEVGGTMKPIYERGPRDYFRKYEPGTEIGKRLGNTMAGDGYLYRGRGLVQITGRRNYALAGAKLGVNLISYPDKALEPDIAAKIIVKGMSEGWFTGKKMADYQSYEDMRRVVNGTDKAGDIAKYARIFERALLAAAQDAEKGVAKVEAPVPEPPRAPAGSVAAVVISVGGMIVAAVLKLLGVI